MARDLSETQYKAAIARHGWERELSPFGEAYLMPLTAGGKVTIHAEGTTRRDRLASLVTQFNDYDARHTKRMRE